MLQEPAHEFHRIQSHCAPSPAIGLFITENHIAVFEVNDTAIGDGHLEDIGGQVLDTVVTVGYGLAVDVKGFVPRAGINGIINPGSLELLPELGFKYF